MGKKDARVDAYIAKSPEFARPILSYIRELVHETCPEVEETFKWRFPCFMYKGMFCSMAAFKEHCSFGFWKYRLLFPLQDNNGMGQFGKLKSVAELPKKAVLRGYLEQAMRFNEQGTKVPRSAPSKKPKRMVVPGYLRSALDENKAAAKTFKALSPSHRREYVEWLTEAKRDETRQKRLSTTLAWLAEGKPRNWKYMNC
jgi:uncharacterized protein YdeI (YjbR/CyaY-like superfamily)